VFHEVNVKQEKFKGKSRRSLTPELRLTSIRWHLNSYCRWWSTSYVCLLYL